MTHTKRPLFEKESSLDAIEHHQIKRFLIMIHVEGDETQMKAQDRRYFCVCIYRYLFKDQTAPYML